MLSREGHDLQNSHRAAKKLGIPEELYKELVRVYKEEFLLPPKSFGQLLEVLE
jgi:hypothetical protein